MIRTAAAVTLAVALAACAGDPAANTPSARVSIATATTGTGGLVVELLADGRLETGMAPLHVSVTASGQPVTDAVVSFEPMMAMSTGMNHACPVWPFVIGADGLYHGATNFGMATSMMGSWSAKVGVTRPGQGRVEASFPSLVVADSGRAKSFQSFDPDAAVTTKFLASVRFPSAPKVGLNPVVITLHRMASMTSFPPVDDAVIHVDPQMPSMGHGSSGNVDPVLVSSGVYEGTLGFSMTGDWETTVTFTRGARTVGAAVFKTTF